ncbi:hypothetical protein SBV1_2350005 [Verrucomicrobia bacterium]|nr:hypothetical protein SBV1_2350005 [Verrucomicrobiota bacterium]
MPLHFFAKAPHDFVTNDFVFSPPVLPLAPISDYQRLKKRSVLCDLCDKISGVRARGRVTYWTPLLWPCWGCSPASRS